MTIPYLIQVEFRNLLTPVLWFAARKSFANHFETLIESVLGARLKHNNSKQHDGTPEGGGGGEPAGGVTIAAIARQIRNHMLERRPVKTALYFLIHVVHMINEHLLSEDSPVTLFTPIDLTPLLCQLGQLQFILIHKIICFL